MDGAPDRTRFKRPARRHARKALLTGLVCALLAAGPALAQVASPHAIDIPRWFSNSLLDFKDEVAEAARDGKRVMVYFGQDGCPYCKALMKANFGLGPIADKTRQNFVAVVINIWGNLDVTWVDGTKTREKALARTLNVQFTPTLLFLETDGQEAEVPVSAPRPYLMRDPANLARAGRGRPLAVLFESPSCKACAEMHAQAFTQAPLRKLLRGFDVARLVPGAPAALLTPDGRRSDARAWARDLNINLYPTVVFFDAQGQEAFRFDGYMRAFHIESAFEYVASGSYRSEPQFQRFVRTRAERLRAQGRAVTCGAGVAARPDHRPA